MTPTKLLDWQEPVSKQILATDKMQITRVTDAVAPESIFVVTMYHPTVDQFAVLDEWLPSQARLNDAEAEETGVLHLEFVADR